MKSIQFTHSGALLRLQTYNMFFYRRLKDQTKQTSTLCKTARKLCLQILGTGKKEHILCSCNGGVYIL